MWKPRPICFILSLGGWLLPSGGAVATEAVRQGLKLPAASCLATPQQSPSIPFQLLVQSAAHGGFTGSNGEDADTLCSFLSSFPSLILYLSLSMVTWCND
jgi:hypothetical protein